MHSWYMVRLSVRGDSNFPEGGHGWGHVILGKLEWGAVYPRILGAGVPENGGADFFVTPGLKELCPEIPSLTL